MPSKHWIRADQEPLGWEIPALIAVMSLLLVVLMLPAGQGAAGEVFGTGFVWPAGSSGLLSSIGGLATGHIGRGLTAAQAAGLPSAGLVYLMIVVAELLLIGVISFSVRLLYRAHGPIAKPGMANHMEVEAALGVSALRKARTIIRPDLYGSGMDDPYGVIADDRHRVAAQKLFDITHKERP